MPKNIWYKKENALYHNVIDVIPNTVLPQVVETMEPQIGEIQNIGSTKNYYK